MLQECASTSLTKKCDWHIKHSLLGQSQCYHNMLPFFTRSTGPLDTFKKESFATTNSQQQMNELSQINSNHSLRIVLIPSRQYFHSLLPGTWYLVPGVDSTFPCLASFYFLWHFLLSEWRVHEVFSPRFTI